MILNYRQGFFMEPIKLCVILNRSLAAWVLILSLQLNPEYFER
jgi:hypothetical protein